MCISDDVIVIYIQCLYEACRIHLRCIAEYNPYLRMPGVPVNPTN